MMKSKKILKILIGIVVFIVLCIAVSYGTYVYRYTMIRQKFQESSYKGQYLQNVPLHEMNFNLYMSVLPADDLMIHPEEKREIALPHDVHYYASKEDDSPAYTLKKGSLVSIDTDRYGQGFVCWPDYEKEWRYGSPFRAVGADSNLSEEILIDSYYVKDAELREVAEAYYQANKSWLVKNYWNVYRKLLSGSYYARIATQAIDSALYDHGSFCAPQYDAY